MVEAPASVVPGAAGNVWGHAGEGTMIGVSA